MTRQEFLGALRRGLIGLPVSAVEEICSDYATHFTDGAEAGRSEAEVAAALGDPNRLAKELRAEAGLQRWERERNPSAAAGAVLSVLGLATVDVILLLPILLVLGSCLLGMFVGSIAVFFAGVNVFGHAIASLRPAAGLAGLGLMCLGVSMAALIIPAVSWLLTLLGRYGRLHYRLLQPALEP
jgi:uncharacterized membrane protein